MKKSSMTVIDRNELENMLLNALDILELSVDIIMPHAQLGEEIKFETCTGNIYTIKCVGKVVAK